MDSVMPVLRNGSKGHNILERLERISVDEPERNEYQLTDESEAQAILTAMAASLMSLANDVKHKPDRQVLLDYAATYRLQVLHKTALNYFRKLTDDDALVIFGLRLTVPVILVQ
jgi:uncharacterized protein YjcR